MDYLPDLVRDHVFRSLTHGDRNAVSLVCKSWYSMDRLSREKVLVCNCYAINPERVIARFPHLVSLTLKGPHNCPGYAYRWIEAMVNSGINLEEVRLKRMSVSDECLVLLAKSFPLLKSLVLVDCGGFTTDGLAAIASNCKFLRELDLEGSGVGDFWGKWLSCFPERSTSLVSLNFACLKKEVEVAALERLVARCPNLRVLKLNPTVPLNVLERILVQAPQLTDLGTSHLLHQPNSEAYIKLVETLKDFESIRSLWVNGSCIPAIYPVCSNLTYLNLIHATDIFRLGFKELIHHCKKLEKLWVEDTIGDGGLGVVASKCKELQELRVFPSQSYEGVRVDGLTEKGLVAISSGCPKLKSIDYHCRHIGNTGLMAVAKHLPNLIRFKLSAMFPSAFKQQVEEGYGAILASCRGLKRLSVSGLVTDQVMHYVAVYGGQLETLSVSFAMLNKGDSLLQVLKRCKKLKKVVMRECRFREMGELGEMGEYFESMRWVWMLRCDVRVGVCMSLAEKMGQRMGVEVKDVGDGVAKNVYLYRTLVGPRKDGPTYSPRVL